MIRIPEVAVGVKAVVMAEVDANGAPMDFSSMEWTAENSDDASTQA